MSNPQSNFLYLFGGAIGDALVGVHLGRTLAANVPGAQLTLISTRENQFVRELLADLTFINYRELPWKRPGSWLALARLSLSSWNTVLYEPATAEVPLWWRTILWCTSHSPLGNALAKHDRSGSHEVHYQMHGHERQTTHHAILLVYNCPTENLFLSVSNVLRAWGVEVKNTLQPALPEPVCVSSAEGSYILFHFFAGNYRRSIPSDHARELLLAARAQFPRHTFFLTCTSTEEALARRASEGVSNTHIAPDLHARELLCRIASADLVVGTASGIIHIAAHMHSRVVSLSNLSDPCWLTQYNPGVAMLSEKSRCGCHGNKTGLCEAKTPDGIVFRCLYDIPTERIITAMQEKLAAY